MHAAAPSNGGEFEGAVDEAVADATRAEANAKDEAANNDARLRAALWRATRSSTTTMPRRVGSATRLTCERKRLPSDRCGMTLRVSTWVFDSAHVRRAVENGCASPSVWHKRTRA